MNTIYRLQDALKQLYEADDKLPLNNALAELFDEMDPQQARLHIFALINDATSGISKVGLPPHRLEDAIGFFVRFQGQFMVNNGVATCGEFKQRLQLANNLQLLSSYGDTLDVAKVEAPSAMNRTDVLDATDQLLKGLGDDEFPPYVREALKLKLLAFDRIVRECAHLTDDDVRRRVKVIYADFCSEFELHDKKYASGVEKVSSWAKKCAAGGAEVLQITAAGMGVAVPLLGYMGGQ